MPATNQIFNITESFPKGDSHRFRPEEILFSSFTGRKQRTPAQIQKMALSLAIGGQLHDLGVRKEPGGVDGNKPIAIFGHTRILGGRLVNQIADLLANGKTDSEIIAALALIEDDGLAADLISAVRNFVATSAGKPFVVRATYFKVSPEQAALMTLFENDESSRTAVDPVSQAENIEFLHQTWGWSYSDIATKIGKRASEVSNLLKVLELDADTQAKLTSGEIKLSTAIHTVAAIAPQQRNDVIEKAKAENGGKATASGIARAARQKGADTAKKLPHTDSDFKRWVRETINNTAVSPQQSFLFAILDYRSGAIDEAALSAAFVKLMGEDAEDAIGASN